MDHEMLEGIKGGSGNVRVLLEIVLGVEFATNPGTIFGGKVSL
jgi:hypothetical protein